MIKNCRIAEPGEFTKLAFQNGKLNLLKAESIGDLISAETDIQMKQALKIIAGSNLKKFEGWRTDLLKILANIVDFQVYFETEDNRLDIYIQQPDRDASPLEMASGAEKTIAAMAVRLAFTNISSLPKSQIFVLDEPGTALDEERMEGFVRILDITTSVFKTVILISHLDNLKDTADSIISIEKKDGYANVVA